VIVAVVLALLLVVAALVLVHGDALTSTHASRTVRRIRDERRATRQWWPEPEEPVVKRTVVLLHPTTVDEKPPVCHRPGASSRQNSSEARSCPSRT
jgi:hypothetical protein